MRKCRDKDLGRAYLARLRAGNIYGVARIINKQAFTSRVSLPHHWREFALPTSIELAIPAIAIAVCVNLSILLPQQRKRHPFAP